MYILSPQISQILKTGGRFVSVTFSQPHFRKLFLAKSEYGWSITINVFGHYFHYFFYVMEKGKELSATDKMMEVAEKKKLHDDVDQCTFFTELEENDENFLENIDLFS
jgi:hypothetical protein